MTRSASGITLALMDWGEGRVLDVANAADLGGAYCDGCDRNFETGQAIEVAATKYGSDSAVLATLCESCFEDVTSDMGVRRQPGSKFLILVVPAFA